VGSLAVAGAGVTPVTCGAGSKLRPMRAADPGRDVAVFWRPPVEGVEVLHARFMQHEYPRHVHESTVVALVDSGAAAFRYRGENHLAPAGSVFFINPDTVHTGEAAGPEGYCYRVLYLGSPVITQLVSPLSRLRAFVTSRAVVWDPRLARLLHRTHTALAAGQSLLQQEEMLLRIGTYLVNRYADTRHATAAQAGPGGHPAVAAAQQYLQANVSAEVRLRELAAVCGSSPYRLVRMFTSEVGMPPHAYQTQLRIRLAQKLLASGIPAASTATVAGFYDQAHLTRSFRRYTGLTPHQYQRGAARTPPW
jgi:AraC-like DNA-binding protein